jgi:hypothetical protein
MIKNNFPFSPPENDNNTTIKPQYKRAKNISEEK